MIFCVNMWYKNGPCKIVQRMIVGGARSPDVPDSPRSSFKITLLYYCRRKGCWL
jgi:hypothetical protein